MISAGHWVRKMIPGAGVGKKDRMCRNALRMCQCRWKSGLLRPGEYTPGMGAGLSEQVRQRLAHEADVPGWMLAGSAAAVPSDRSLRVWELVEDELNDPHVALRVGLTHDPRCLGLRAYLFMTAPTLGEGFATTGAYLNTLTTNFTFALAEEEPTFDIGHCAVRDVAEI